MSRSLLDTTPSDRTGQVVRQKYRLIRCLGQGGMGTVYEAEHVVVGRRFAVKFLNPELCDSDEALSRFRREAQATGSLENEHIAAVTDFDLAEDGSPFIVLEYLAGESLAELLAREGPLAVPRATAALKQVCHGLEAAHAAGIIHRDLKPDNLFVVRRRDGRELVKILDFGIAKLQRPDAGASLTRSGATLGTPFYMAPEQARGDKVFDHRVDIHAVGVILYELLCGQKPHPGDSYNAILAHILGQRPPSIASLRPGLPGALVELVHACLEADPKQRPASATELARLLERFAGTEVSNVRSQLELRVLSSATPTVDVHVDVAPRRFPKVLMALGLCVCVGIALLAWRRSAAPPAAAELRPEPAKAAPTPSGAGVARASVADAAHALIARASAAPSGHSSGRPPGRPAPVAKSTAGPAREAAAPPRSAAKAAAAPLGSASAGNRRAVTFDTQNPYE